MEDTKMIIGSTENPNSAVSTRSPKTNRAPFVGKSDHLVDGQPGQVEDQLARRRVQQQQGQQGLKHPVRWR